VLGVLVEKANTTPGAYPLTVNAIVTGCNQKNNRDPLTEYDDIEVERALDELRTIKAVSEIDWLGRVPKYKHHAFEWLGVNRTEVAVMTELLLRGAQALGDLRARAARMAPIADLAALKPIVDALLERGLMIELTPPGRGQVVSHNLHAPTELEALRAQYSGHAARAQAFEPGEAGPRQSAAPTAHRSAESVPGAEAPPGLSALAAEVTELRTEVARLREKIGTLEVRLGR
jgi:hypothetical protein